MAVGEQARAANQYAIGLVGFFAPYETAVQMAARAQSSSIAEISSGPDLE